MSVKINSFMQAESFLQAAKLASSIESCRAQSESPLRAIAKGVIWFALADNPLFQTIMGLSSLASLYCESTLDRMKSSDAFDALAAKTFAEVDEHPELKSKLQRVVALIQKRIELHAENAASRNGLNALIAGSALMGSRIGMMLTGAVQFAKSWESATNQTATSRARELEGAVSDAIAAIAAAKTASETLPTTIPADVATESADVEA